MIVTDDDSLAELLRSLRNHGRDHPHPAENPTEWSSSVRAGTNLAHARLGFNYKLSEIACGLGIAQMERLDELLEARRRVASSYMTQLMEFEDLILPNIDVDLAGHMSWFAFVVRLSSEFGQLERDRVMSGLRRHDIGASNFFPCIPMQPFYRKAFGCQPGDFPIAESVAARVIALPFFTRMDDTTIELVVQTLKIMLSRERLLKRDS